MKIDNLEKENSKLRKNVHEFNKKGVILLFSISWI